MIANFRFKDIFCQFVCWIGELCKGQIAVGLETYQQQVFLFKSAQDGSFKTIYNEISKK